MSDESERFVSAIEELTSDVGNSVIISSNDPTGGVIIKCAIEYIGDWTKWNLMRFEGGSKLYCLERAVKHYRMIKETQT